MAEAILEYVVCGICGFNGAFSFLVSVQNQAFAVEQISCLRSH